MQQQQQRTPSRPLLLTAPPQRAPGLSPPRLPVAAAASPYPTAGQFGPVQPAFHAGARYTGRQIKNRLHALAVRILRVKGERGRPVAALLAHSVVGLKRGAPEAKKHASKKKAAIRPKKHGSKRRRRHTP